MITTPCEHCRKRLPVRVSTDGMGQTIDVPDPCQCEDARWRRGECVECGSPVQWKNRKRLPRKRCPRHLRHHVQRKKEEWARQNPEYFREWERKRRRRDARYRLRQLEYSRRYREQMRRVRS